MTRYLAVAWGAGAVGIHVVLSSQRDVLPDLVRVGLTLGFVICLFGVAAVLSEKKQ